MTYPKEFEEWFRLLLEQQDSKGQAIMMANKMKWFFKWKNGINEDDYQI